MTRASAVSGAIQRFDCELDRVDANHLSGSRSKPPPVASFGQATLTSIEPRRSSMRTGAPLRDYSH
jgi:hypothetical protein